MTEKEENLEDEEIIDESESDVDEIINGDDESESEDDGSNKRFFIFLGVIIGILIIVLAGFFVYNKFFTPTGAVTIDDLHKTNIEGKESDKNYIYNGFSFVYIDGLWYTQVQKGNDTIIDIPLHYGPKDLEDIEITGLGVDNSFMKNVVYVTFDPTKKPLGYVALASAELSLNLARGMGIIPIAACLNNQSNACIDRPIITCESGEAAIYVKQSNETGVILDGNCVIIQGQDYDLIRATDRFLLQWYTVMD